MVEALGGKLTCLDCIEGMGRMYFGYWVEISRVVVVVVALTYQVGLGYYFGEKEVRYYCCIGIQM